MLHVVNTQKKIIFISLMIILFFILYYISTRNYLIPHALMELTGSAVAITIFSIGWNTRKFSHNNMFIILALGSLLVGILSILHVFVEYGNDVTTQFWVATRYVESFTLFFAVFYLSQKVDINIKIVWSMTVLIGLLLILSIFFGFFPSCLNDKGLTPFKIYSELVICGIFFISGIILFRKKHLLDKEIKFPIFFSIILSILSELSFTQYNNPYGFFNLLGHYLMFSSILLLYHSLVSGSLSKPYHVLFDNISLYIDELAFKNDELRKKDHAIASSINGILLADTYGYITYVNKSFLKLLGYQDKKEVIGKSILEFFHNANQTEVKVLVSLKGNWSGDILAKKKDGKHIDCFLIINYFYSQDNKQEGMMASFIDVTKLKKTELALLKAKQEAEAATVAKSKFLANMSHEIRTPLNGIIGFIHLLENTPLNHEQLEYLDNIKSSSDTLLTVINDILDVSKIEAGKLHLENIAFDLHHTIDKAVSLYEAKAKEKDLLLNLKIAEDVPRYVIGDPVRLKQVISNLISNAIKFTEIGYVKVTVFNKMMTDEICDLEFSVKDSGIGMSQAFKAEIFKPFAQADLSTTRKFGGTGLGLTICKSIIGLMDGHIDIESEEGKGTNFILKIPLKIAKINERRKIEQEIYKTKTITVFKEKQMNEDEQIMHLSEELHPYSSLKVLLVEDNMVNQILFTSLLEKKRINCDVATNGREAVLACEKEIYDLIFMDCQMPIMDGYEATKKIRSMDNTNKKAVIIAMTAHAMKGDADKCVEAGMTDYLSKPINFDKVNDIFFKYGKEILEPHENHYNFITKRC